MKTVITAALLSALALPSFAGNVAEPIVEAPIPAVIPAGSSLSPLATAAAVVAGALVLAAVLDDDDESTSSTPNSPAN